MTQGIITLPDGTIIPAVQKVEFQYRWKSTLGGAPAAGDETFLADKELYFLAARARGGDALAQGELEVRLAAQPSRNLPDNPLYVITHSELSAGYQVAQTIHATANIALEYPTEFAAWHAQGQRVVALEVGDEEDLWQLIEKSMRFPEANFQVVRFHEPDLDNALTAFALVPNKWNALLTQGLNLAGTATGDLNKHTFTGELA